MDKIIKLNNQSDPFNYQDLLNVSVFLQEKSLLKRSYDSAMMPDADASEDDTVRSPKKSKMLDLEMG